MFTAAFEATRRLLPCVGWATACKFSCVHPCCDADHYLRSSCCKATAQPKEKKQKKATQRHVEANIRGSKLLQRYVPQDTSSSKELISEESQRTSLSLATLSFRRNVPLSQMNIQLGSLGQAFVLSRQSKTWSILKSHSLNFRIQSGSTYLQGCEKESKAALPHLFLNGSSCGPQKLQCASGSIHMSDGMVQDSQDGRRCVWYFKDF